VKTPRHIAFLTAAGVALLGAGCSSAGNRTRELRIAPGGTVEITRSGWFRKEKIVVSNPSAETAVVTVDRKGNVVMTLSQPVAPFPSLGASPSLPSALPAPVHVTTVTPPPVGATVQAPPAASPVNAPVSGETADAKLGFSGTLGKGKSTGAGVDIKWDNPSWTITLTVSGSWVLLLIFSKKHRARCLHTVAEICYGARALWSGSQTAGNTQRDTNITTQTNFQDGVPISDDQPTFAPVTARPVSVGYTRTRRPSARACA
jgi:hypothetical protein